METYVLWSDADGTLWVGVDDGSPGFRFNADGTAVVSTIGTRLDIYTAYR